MKRITAIITLIFFSGCLPHRKDSSNSANSELANASYQFRCSWYTRDLDLKFVFPTKEEDFAESQTDAYLEAYIKLVDEITEQTTLIINNLESLHVSDKIKQNLLNELNRTIDESERFQEIVFEFSFTTDSGNLKRKNLFLNHRLFDKKARSLLSALKQGCQIIAEHLGRIKTETKANNTPTEIPLLPESTSDIKIDTLYTLTHLETSKPENQIFFKHIMIGQSIYKEIFKKRKANDLAEALLKNISIAYKTQEKLTSIKGGNQYLTLYELPLPGDKRAYGIVKDQIFFISLTNGKIPHESTNNALNAVFVRSESEATEMYQNWKKKKSILASD